MNDESLVTYVVTGQAVVCVRLDMFAVMNITNSSSDSLKKRVRRI